MIEVVKRKLPVSDITGITLRYASDVVTRCAGNEVTHSANALPTDGSFESASIFLVLCKTTS